MAHLPHPLVVLYGLAFLIRLSPHCGLCRERDREGERLVPTSLQKMAAIALEPFSYCWCSVSGNTECIFNFSLSHSFSTSTLFSSLPHPLWVILLFDIDNNLVYFLSNLQVKFAEPQEQDCQELFGWISFFIGEFKKASAHHMS